MFGYMPPPPTRFSRRRRRANPPRFQQRRYLNPALSLSMGPDLLIQSLREEMISEMPQFGQKISALFSKYNAQIRQMIIQRAVVVYKDDFLRDVRAVMPQVIAEMA